MTTNGDGFISLSALEPHPRENSQGIDRRAFLMRNAVIGAVSVITGCSRSAPDAALAAPAVPQRSPPLGDDLHVVKKSKGPVMTTLDEFYKVGPGPSSSHTIGPMRITDDFYKRCTTLPSDQLAKATGIKVHLYGSLSATGKGHGTERAALAGVIGKEPSTVEPEFLDSACLTGSVRLQPDPQPPERVS
jgi:L-serine dehydratase